MILNMLKSKIHRAKVTEANLDYIGSITIDEVIMNAANILEYERVHVLNITNGNRLETYVIKGKKGSGCICINGAAHITGGGIYGNLKRVIPNNLNFKIDENKIIENLPPCFNCPLNIDLSFISV